MDCSQPKGESFIQIRSLTCGNTHAQPLIPSFKGALHQFCSLSWVNSSCSVLDCCENSCIMSCVALEKELCHIWENYPDDVMIMSLGLSVFGLGDTFLTKSQCYKLGLWSLKDVPMHCAGEVNWKMLLSCFMGNVGSSISGVLEFI